MPYYQLHITAQHEAHAEQLEETLLELGALSITFSDSEDEPILEPALNTTPLWSKTTITALFNELDIFNHCQAALKSQGLNFRIEKLADTCWERAWIKDFKPMCFGRRLWVCPSNQKPPVSDAINVILDPGLAFGTGTHATTALCLTILDNLELKQKSVVDYGCGSGILAISALKLGALKAYATDIDPQAIEATLENAKRNHIDLSDLDIQLAAEFNVTQVDLLMANILAEPLVELAQRLCSMVKPKGFLILSGLLENQKNSVLEAYKPWCQMITCQKRDGWIALVMQKNTYL